MKLYVCDKAFYISLKIKRIINDFQGFKVGLNFGLIFGEVSEKLLMLGS